MSTWSVCMDRSYVNLPHCQESRVKSKLGVDSHHAIEPMEPVVSSLHHSAYSHNRQFRHLAPWSLSTYSISSWLNSKCIHPLLVSPPPGGTSGHLPRNCIRVTQRLPVVWPASCALVGLFFSRAFILLFQSMPVYSSKPLAHDACVNGNHGFAWRIACAPCQRWIHAPVKLHENNQLG